MSRPKAAGKTHTSGMRVLKLATAVILALGGACAGILSGPVALGQTPRGLPPGAMQEKARTACLGCHTTSIIVQQQLDRRLWAKVMDKMIRWGTPVAPEDREALIDYFAQHFGPQPEPVEAALPSGPGADKVRAACLTCHDSGIIVQERLSRRAWASLLDKMIRWGAPVRAQDREIILSYLARNFAASPKSEQETQPK